MERHVGPIRWGIAATGKISTSFAEAFAQLDDGILAAVGSRAQESADAFAATHGIERAHPSYEALSVDPDVDIVYVGSLTSDHCRSTTMFLEAGKHVLCEKPLGRSAADVDRMAAAAAGNDRFLMEAMWTRFNPVHVEAMRRIHAGEIGMVRRVYADFSFILPPGSEDHRLLALDKGGSSLLDLGIYPLTIAWWALGEPTTVGHAGRVAATGADDEVAMLCTWDDGAVALLTCGLTAAGTMGARIEGTHGSVTFDPPGHASRRAVLQKGAETEEITGDPPSLHHQAVEVHRCLREGLTESPRRPLATTRSILARCDEIRAGLGVVYADE